MDPKSSSFMSSPRFSLKTRASWKAMACEATATAIVSFIVGGVIANTRKESTHSSTETLNVAIATGIAYASMTHTFGHLSGAQMNPAVSVALFAARIIRFTHMCCYVTAQLVGALIGSAILDSVTKRKHKTGPAVMADNIDAAEGFGMEFILAFVLAICVLSTIDPENKALSLRYTGGVWIGLAYAMLTFVGYPWTAAALNPARAFGASVVAGKFQDHWVFWLGPIAGAMLGSLTYVIFFDLGRPVRDPLHAFAASAKQEKDTEFRPSHVESSL